MGDGYYDSIASGYSELHGAEQLRKAHVILDNIVIESDDRLLDVGCGNASYLSIFPCVKKGIDPSVGLLKQASIPVVEGVAENLPFEDNSFEIVLSLTAIHHFSDIKKALSEIFRVCSRDIIISVLKKCHNFKDIESAISEYKPYKRVEDLHDSIFFMRKFK